MSRNRANKRKVDVETLGDLPAIKRKSRPLVESTYKLNDRVLCKSTDNFYYEAKIIKLNDEKGCNGYFIHYKGWKKIYDEFLTENDAKQRFKPYNTENAKNAAKEVKEARKLQNEAKKLIKLAKSSAEKSTPKTTSKSIENSTENASSKLVKKESKASNLNQCFDADNVFASLITDGLFCVLCEENDKIVKQQKLPRIPTKTSVEDIFKQFLKSEQVEIGDSFETLLESIENFQLKTARFDEKLAFFLHIFNALFPQLLIYPEEKSILDQLFAEESKGQGDVSNHKRYSKYLGFTHFLRFVARLSDFLEKILGSDSSLLVVFTDAINDLCKYLEANVSKFYNAEEYYMP